MRTKTDWPVIGIAGWKNSGKTTLAVGLIAELTRRGWRVSSIKHAHHAFQIDDAETDSARHRRAGAREVAIVSSRRWAIVHETADGEDEPDFAEVVRWLSPADLVIVEGYKSQPIPKIEARRRAAAQTTPLAATDPHVIAIAADHSPDDVTVPVLALDDVPAIADFVVAHLRLPEPRRGMG